MINRSDYTEDEWAEYIGRAILMTEGHEWKVGDWIFIIDYDVSWLSEEDKIAIYCGPGKDWDPEEDGPLGYWASVVPSNGAEDGCCLYIPVDNLVWLPRLDQLVRMEAWKGGGLFGFDKEWEISSDMAGLESEGPTPEMAVMRK